MRCPVPALALLGCLLSFTATVSAKQIKLPESDAPVPANQPIPSRDFARPLMLEDPVLNPAGTHFAAFTKNEELKNSLLICEIATGKLEWSRGDVWSFDWISNTHLMLNGDGGLVIDIKDPRRDLSWKSFLPEFKRGLMPDTGFLWSWRPRNFPDPLSVSIQETWDRPEDGEPAYSAMINLEGHRSLRRYEKNSWVECPVDLNEITPVAIGSQPGEMIVLGPRAKGKPRAIQRMNVLTNTLGEVIYQDAQYDCVAWVGFKRGTREINAVSVPNSANRIIWLNEKMKQTQGLLNKQFTGSHVRIVSSDITETRFLVEVQSDRQPPVIYFFDQEKKSLGLIKNTAPWIEPARMRPTQVMAYKARDGVAIEGYLTLPAGASKEHPVPLVVAITGGPWLYRYSWGWDESAQFLASRGYAVFTPNFRGCISYDSRIEPDDRFDFLKMQHDVADGVHLLIKSGLIDPKRVAVEGVGFGSYLALCGAIEEPELYRCAVLYGGLYDWEKALHRNDSRTRFDDEWLRRQLESRNQKPFSPLQHPGQIKIPVFFTRNVRVRDSTYDDQAHEMYRALKSHVPVTNYGDLNLYEESEAYGELVERLDKIEEFLAQNMAPK